MEPSRDVLCICRVVHIGREELKAVSHCGSTEEQVRSAALQAPLTKTIHMTMCQRSK
jgi:hypothetical protein